MCYISYPGLINLILKTVIFNESKQHLDINDISVHAWLQRLQCALLSIYANESRGSFLLEHVLGDVWMLFESLSLKKRKKHDAFVSLCNRPYVFVCSYMLEKSFFFLRVHALALWHVCECVRLSFINTSRLYVLVCLVESRAHSTDHDQEKKEEELRQQCV